MSFPETFPDDFETNILPEDVSFEDITVYRVLKFGELNNDAFISTHDEILRELRVDNIAQDNPSRYSTSCYNKLSKAKKCLRLFMKHDPRAKLAVGITKGSCGPHQETYIRTHDKDDKYHIDWWIYKDASPVDYFEMVNENE